MAEVLAYFLTWTTYGTRLHGDDRGTVDRHHNMVGTPFLPSDPTRLSREVALMDAAPYVLAPEARILVEATIRRHCDVRTWRLNAANVRTTLVHVVVGCEGRVSPEAAMEQLKAWCTRRLRETGLAGSAQRVWTEHGSTRWLDSPESF